MKKTKTNIKNKLSQFITILVIMTVISLGVVKLLEGVEKISLTNKQKAINFFYTGFDIAEVTVKREEELKTPMEKFYYAFENDKYFQNYIVNMNVKRNNPGNLRCANQPYSGCDKGFAVFPSPLVGFRALIKQIELDMSRGDTLESFVKDYAPSFENDTQSYISFLEGRLGSRYNKLKDLDILLLTVSIVQKEHGLKY